MFYKISIRIKMIFVMAFMLVILAGIGLLAIGKMRTINSYTVDIATNWLPSISALGDLRTNTQKYRAVLRQFVLEADPARKTAAAKAIDGVTEDQARFLKNYESFVNSPEERETYETLTREWSRYLSAAREVMDAAGKENDVTKASNLLVNKTSPIAQIIDEVLKKDVASNQTGANVATQDAEEAYALAFKLIVSIFALSILLAAVAGFYLVRDIMQGITSIITPMRALANGDLTAVIPHQGNKTEIGAIADTLQMFKEALVAKKFADEFRALADASAKIVAATGDNITREFEATISELIGSLSSSST